MCFYSLAVPVILAERADRSLSVYSHVYVSYYSQQVDFVFENVFRRTLKIFIDHPRNITVKLWTRIEYDDIIV